MSKSQWKAIALSLLFALSMTLLSLGFLVFPQKSSAQITSVSEMLDVSPTDWYFQPMQSLVERYGILQAYSDRTFRANEPSTRAEVASLMNSGLDVLTSLVAQSGVGLDDIATLRRVAEELVEEISILRGRLDAAESGLIELENELLGQPW